ncbi:AAA family ATPase [Candidatus Babeliales bacterium]|nr:AAA family ATPase [Candidatus Babeliales bacterium]MBP9844016.1 AAA family ATPase [Candidatus Babeliales bacterium]
MNITTKKLFFPIITLFLLHTHELVYTKEAQDENNNRSVMATDNTISQSDSEYDKDILEFIEEMFQSVTDQTQKIEYNLQQIELILNAGKIKFDHQKISKSELLAEIKEIKFIIQSIYEFYTTQMDKDEAIVKGTCFNTAFINYLLPIIQSDINNLNADTFDKSVAENFETIIKNLEDLDQIPLMIEKNKADLKLLGQASDNIGLNTFNKIYRYLDTKALPISGKSTFATLEDIAFWSAAGFTVYNLAIWGLTTESTKLPFGIKLPYCGDKFPFQKRIGNHTLTDDYIIQQDPMIKRDIKDNFGWANYLDLQARSLDKKLMTLAGGYLATQIKGPVQDLYKTMKKSVNESISYYCKGDNLSKNSNTVPKTYFKDMIGGQDLEKLARELADYLKNPTRYERAGITPSTGYLLVGPSQTGKSFFAKALKTLIDEEFGDDNENVKFFSITADDVQYFGGFARIFSIALRDAPCILFIDELDMHGARRDRDAKNTQELLTAINGVETDQDKKIIVIAATNKPEELDFALKQKGRLGTVITFDFPTYECRKTYLEKQLNKKNIALSADMIETISQETDGHTYNMIDDIVRQSMQLATYETRPVCEADFEITLDREIRKIKPNTTISTQEKELVAIYQAGQAAARHILKTDQQIVKITIDAVDKPIKSKEGQEVTTENKAQQYDNLDLLPTHRVKPTRLGFVFTMSKINNHELLSDEDQEIELMALLAGQAALEIVKGKVFNEFGKEDRAKILEALEKKISQGTPITDSIRLQAMAAKDVLYKKVKAVLNNHKDFIKIITHELLQNTTLNKKQWNALATNYPVK